MDNTKKWWESRTVWAGLVMIAAAIAGGCGIAVDEGTQVEIVDYITLIAGAVGGLLAVYGRIKAEKQIK